MARLALLLQEAVLTARPHRGWMTWNLLLAAVPALLAVVLFARPHRRTLTWWIGVVAFVLTLPNAPYVVTDLVHLRHSVSTAATDGLVLGVVLPLYVAFILTGFLAYVLCTELVAREVRTVRPSTPRWAVEAALHLTCAVGILVGRFARLNSWDTVTDPANTVERTFETLTWRWAPAAFVMVLIAVWITHLVVRTLAAATADAGRVTWRHLQPGGTAA